MNTVTAFALLLASGGCGSDNICYPYRFDESDQHVHLLAQSGLNLSVTPELFPLMESEWYNNPYWCIAEPDSCETVGVQVGRLFSGSTGCDFTLSVVWTSPRTGSAELRLPSADVELRPRYGPSGTTDSCLPGALALTAGWMTVSFSPNNLRIDYNLSFEVGDTASFQLQGWSKNLGGRFSRSSCYSD